MNYIDQFDLPSFIHDENDWIVNVEKQLEAALVFYSHFSAIFLTDLKAEFPHEYQLLQGKIVDHNLHLLEFFRAGQEAGIFNSSKPELWILQDQLMVPRLNAPDYSQVNNQGCDYFLCVDEESADYQAKVFE